MKDEMTGGLQKVDGWSSTDRLIMEDNVAESLSVMFLARTNELIRTARE